MLFFRNGQIWVHSVPNRPALGATSASLFFIGLIVVLHKIKYQNKWEFVVLLISVPILMMPSILSLAYPAENPSLNRSAGAYVPIFLIIGIGFVYIKDTLIELLPKKISKIAAVLFCIAIGLTSIQNNYQLVFLKYRHQFDENSWNTSEIGAVIQKFVQKGGENDHAFVVPFPHWVDTRLVGFNAGFPGKDYALSKNEISEIPNDGEEKIFIFKPDDLEVQNSLEQYFPGGKSSIYYSDIPGKDFLIYTVE